METETETEGYMFRAEGGYRETKEGMADGGGKGADQVGDGGGVIESIFLRQSHCIGGGLVGGGPDPERGGGVLRHRPSGGDMEGGGGDFQLLLHRRYHLPQLPPQVPGRSRYGDHHP